MPNISNTFGIQAGYPSWQDYIPTQKAQTLIMSIMSYQSYHPHTAAVINSDNMITSLGTMFFFTTDGHYAVIEPNSSIIQPRIQLSYDDSTLVSRYYQYPLPGIDPQQPDFSFPDDYIPGIPPIYVDNGPTWATPQYSNWTFDLKVNYTVELTGVYSILEKVPNLAQPFYNTDAPVNSDGDYDISSNIGANVYGYFVPPPPLSPSNPWVIAFHCIGSGKQYSNNPLDTLDYYKYQSLLIRTKGTPSYTATDTDGNTIYSSDLVDSDNNLVDKIGNKIYVITYINEVDYLEIDPNIGGQNQTFGYNLTYNSFVFSFRGSKYIPDFTSEVIPPEIAIANVKLSNPESLLKRYRPFLVNKASAMYKSIAADTIATYYYTPFPDDESIVIQNNYPISLGILCFTGHSSGGAIANILAEYLINKFPDYLNAETYAFAPPAFQLESATPLNPEDYKGSLYIRTFINNNDCVPFFKPPNPLDYDQTYIVPFTPPELYAVYRINTINSISKLELVNKIILYDGGIPVYLFFNNNHDMQSGYIKNINSIDPTQFENTVKSNFNTGISFGITILTAKKLFNQFLKTSIAAKLSGLTNTSTNSTSKTSAITSLAKTLYSSLGLNTISVNYVNLLKSLK